MSLADGTYQIRSILTTETIGRDRIENRSYGPKPIIVQKSNLDYGYTNWQVECWNDHHYLKNGGAAVGLVIGDTSGRIVAILKEGFGGRSREWILRPAAGTEEGGTYNICNPDEGSNLVWTIENEGIAPNRDRQILALAEFDSSNSRQVFTFIKENN